MNLEVLIEVLKQLEGRIKKEISVKVEFSRNSLNTETFAQMTS